ncbi:MAG: glycine zipper family protein, partial [Deltaproteobacteria bacterium]|nr:glycine zipper family protein [Deltaproteobacteria bacterium]
RTYLVDVKSNLWPILGQDLAYDRIEKKTELGEILPEGAQSGLLAGAAGAVIGAAIGIVTGTNVGEAAGKGAAVGAAAGVTMGGAKGLTSREVSHRIGEDLRNRSLEDRPAPSNDVSHGFIFFPGEAKDEPRELRLALKEVDTGAVHSIIMKF